MVRLSASSFVIRGILRSIYHSITTVVYFVIFGLKLFEMPIPKGQSMNFGR